MLGFFAPDIAVFPILADVFEVKTGSRASAHWSSEFIRLNGWLRNSMGPNSEGSNTVVLSVLSAQALIDCCRSRLSSISPWAMYVIQSSPKDRLVRFTSSTL